MAQTSESQIKEARANLEKKTSTQAESLWMHNDVRQDTTGKICQINTDSSIFQKTQTSSNSETMASSFSKIEPTINETCRQS